LIFFKKNAKQKGITLDEAVEEAIRFGWIDGKLRRLDEDRFILRFSPRRANSVWSKLNKERAEKLIASGKMTSAGLAKVEEAKKSGSWDNAYSNATFSELPDDLKNALMKNNDAWNNFSSFAATYKNMYIGWVIQAKTQKTRQQRIKKVVEQSIHNKKQIFL
jgi:uncharacterized protein YdeI (YjbR/CyaY-like superfamily)